MADPNKKVATDLTPEEEAKIETAVLGREKLNRLRNPDVIEQIVSILNDADASFVDSFSRIKVMERMNLDAGNKKQLDKKVTVLINSALEKKRDSIEEKIEKHKRNIEKKREKFLRSYEYNDKKEELDDEVKQNTKTKKEAKKALKEFLDANINYDCADDFEMVEKLEDLLSFIDNPPEHIFDFEEDVAEHEKTKKAEAEKEEEDKQKQEEEERQKKLKEEEESAKPKTPQEMDVKNPDDFKIPADIENAVMKWSAVINDLGRNPKEGDKLFWKPVKEEAEPVELSEDDIKKYQAFQEYFKKRPYVEKKIIDWLSLVNIQLQKIVSDEKKPIGPDELNNKISEAAEVLIRKLEDEGGENNAQLSSSERALLYYVLKVKNKSKAFEKLQNIIYFRTTVDIPGRKGVYEIARDEEGKMAMVGLDDFLNDHKTYGEKMISDAHEVLGKLYEKYGEAYGDKEAMRNVLIDVIKTRGGKDLDVDGKKIPKGLAKKIYTDILLAKDPHTGEKELIALLIAFKAQPPAVYDIYDDTKGWVLGPKKTGMYVLKDFAVDGSIYSEVKMKLGLSTKNINEFLIKVSPWFGKIRSIIESTADGESVNIDEIKLFLPEFTEEDLSLFKKLMAIPLWPDKVGHAYKYAKYLDELEIYVPVIKETQGPETKEVNVAFVNVDEKLKRVSERLADERLDQELKEIGPQGWKELYKVHKIAGKWWKRNAAEGYRDKYKREYLERIKTDPEYRADLMRLNRDEVKPGGLGEKLTEDTPKDGDQQSLERDLDAIAERFGIAWETGEAGSYLTENERSVENVENIEIQNRIKQICKDYENNLIDDAGFRQRMKADVIPLVRALHDPPDAAIAAFLEETGNERDDVEKFGLLDKMKAHKAGLLALDIDNMMINIRVGKAQNVDVKTQVKDLGLIDQMSRGFVERIQRNRFLGRFLSPGTAAVMGYGLANMAGQVATSSVARYGTLATVGILAPSLWPAVTGIGAACLVGGAFNSFRQRKEVLRLKALKERREAAGYRPDDDTKGMMDPKFERDMEAAGALYEKADVDDLMSDIESNDAYNEKMAAVARAIALNDISELGLRPGELNNSIFFREKSTRIDLIKFKHTARNAEEERTFSLEGQRLDLVKTISRGQIALRAMGGTDADRQLADAVANARATVIENMRLKEKAFMKLKLKETAKAAGVGAAIAGVISGSGLLLTELTDAFSTTTAHTVNLTPQGATNPAAFEEALMASGISKTDAHSIVGMVKFDPTGKIDPASVAAIKSKYGIDVTGMMTPDTLNVVPVALHGGLNMDQADFVKEVYAIDPTVANQLKFDSAGKLTPASLTLLKNSDFNVSQHVSTIPEGPGASFNASPEWETLSKVHFVDNQPHTPGRHILDELRMWWSGKPSLGADGNYHFTIKGMFDPSLKHSNLPPGVSMPGSPADMKIGMQMTENGINYWKFFSPDANGNISISPEYFDPMKVGVVPRGGSHLPGLKTTAMAVMFEDKNGTNQILASVRGDGSFNPPSTKVEFSAEFLEKHDVPGEEVLGATKTELETVTYGAAVPPLSGSPMRHLEYGKGQRREEESESGETQLEETAEGGQSVAPDQQVPDQPEPTAPDQPAPTGPVTEEENEPDQIATAEPEQTATILSTPVSAETSEESEEEPLPEPAPAVIPPPPSAIPDPTTPQAPETAETAGEAEEPIAEPVAGLPEHENEPVGTDLALTEDIPREIVNHEIPTFESLNARLENFDTLKVDKKERDLIYNKLSQEADRVRMNRSPLPADIEGYKKDMAVLAGLKPQQITADNESKVKRTMFMKTVKFHPDRSENPAYVEPIFKGIQEWTNEIWGKLENFGEETGGAVDQGTTGESAGQLPS